MYSYAARQSNTMVVIVSKVIKKDTEKSFNDFLFSVSATKLTPLVIKSTEDRDGKP